MKRLLLVSHRPITQEAGPAARWRSFARWLPELGWQVDVISAAERAGNVEFAGDARSRRLEAGQCGKQCRGTGYDRQREYVPGGIA